MINGNGPEDDGDRLRDMTGDIVVAALSNPNVSLPDLPSLIAEIHGTFLNLGRAKPKSVAVAHNRRSTDQEAGPETIPTCLECGKSVRRLKDHLAKQHHMKVMQYRAKHGIPASVPIDAVAPLAAVSIGTPIMDPQAAITPDHIVCLECGKQTQIMGTHLKNQHGWTPAQYRQRFDLPGNYPMTSEAFRAMASQRAIAHNKRLGPEHMAKMREQRHQTSEGRDAAWNVALSEAQEGESGKTRQALLGNG